jgi:hypothetical protein
VTDPRAWESDGPIDQYGRSLAGMTPDQLEQMAAAYRASQTLPQPAPAASVCHAEGCENAVTHQTQRDGTGDEAEQHWAALEQHIRAAGNPEYVQQRGPVTVARHHCDEPGHADPAYLEAQAAAAADVGRQAIVPGLFDGFTHEQLLQLADAIQRNFGGAG